jgi:hypothetical protein
MEVWKDIQGFAGIYQISSHGRLKSFKMRRNGYILSNVNKNGGYLSVVLTQNGRSNRYTRIHRLVAETFKPKPLGVMEVNHKDGNKQNNHVDNLEWVTHRDNLLEDVRRNPGRVAGMCRYNQIVRPRQILQFSLDGRLLATFNNGAEAARSTGVCQRNIHQVASQDEYKPGMTRKQAGGYIWKYGKVG